MTVRPLMLALAASLLCAVFIALQPSYDAEITEGTCGDDATWSFDSETGTLTIEGTGEMRNYSNSGFSPESRSPWYGLPVETVIIGKDITRIGSNAFYKEYGDTIAIKEVILPEDSRLESIGAGAFAERNVIANTQNGIRSFHIGSSVRTVETGAFQYCRSLVTLTMDEGVESIGANTFEGTGIESVIIPDSVTYVGELAFASCPDLKNVIIGDNLESVYRVFEDSDGIEDIVFGNSMTSLIVIGDTAYVPPRCTSLVWSGIYHGNIASGLVYIPTLVHISGMIVGGLIPETVREFVVDPASPVFSSHDGVLYNRDMTELILYPAAKEGSHFDIPRGVRTIGNTAMYKTKLSSVSIPDTVTKIGAYAIQAEESITVPSSVTSLDERSVSARVVNMNATIPVLSWLNIGYYTEVLNLGRGIQALDVTTTPPYYVNPNERTIRLYVPLKNILTNISEINVDPDNQTLTSRGGVLYSSDMKRLLYVPQAMKGDTFIMPNSVEYMAGNQPQIGRFVNATAIGNNGFSDITDPGYLLSAGMFQYTGFKEVVLSDNLMVIGAGAFYENTHIQKIKIPASVIKVGERAFESAYNVKWMYLEGKLPSTGYRSFYFGIRNHQASISLYSPTGPEGFLDRPAGVYTALNYNQIEESREETGTEAIMGNPVYVLAGLGLISLGVVAFEVIVRRRR